MSVPVPPVAMAHQDPVPPLTDRAADLLDRFGSPLFVFDAATLRTNYRTLRDALDAHYPDSRIHYAVKANYNLGVLAALREAGCGAEAYARCELAAARRAGFAPADVVVTGQNRRQADLERALSWGVDRVLVDNADELDRLTAAAKATGTDPMVLLRANPAMEVPTRPEIATATRESKFGLDVASGRAMAVAEAAVASDTVRLGGLQLHIGSQITDPEPYGVAARALVDFAATVQDEFGVTIDVLDLGGGFPVAYNDDVPAAETIVAHLADTVTGACDAAGFPEPELLLEPGRRLAGPAGTLLATVGSIKETPYARFAVLDAGTNVVSTHWPYPIHGYGTGPTQTYDIAGPLCYTGDVIQEDVTLPELSVGDPVAIHRVGAYSLSDASHTNAQPKPAAVLLDDDGTHLVREREDCADVLDNDRVPAHFRE